MMRQQSPFALLALIIFVAACDAPTRLAANAPDTQQPDAAPDVLSLDALEPPDTLEPPDAPRPPDAAISGWLVETEVQLDITTNNGLANVEIIALGEGFAILTNENIEGRYRARLYVIDGDGVLKDAGRDLSDREEGRLEDVAARERSDGGAWVLWSTERDDSGRSLLWMRAVDAEGEVGARVDVEGDFTSPFYVSQIEPSADGGALELLVYFPLSGAPSYRYRDHHLRVSLDGARLLEPVSLREPLLSADEYANPARWLWPDGLVWAENIPGAGGALMYAPLSGTPPQPVTSSTQIHAIERGAAHLKSVDNAGGVRLAGLYDTEAGARLVDVDRGEVVATLSGDDRPVVVAYPTLGWGVLGEADFTFLDADFAPVAAALSFGNDAEHHDLARNGERFGVAWIHGSRTLSFARVLVRRR